MRPGASSEEETMITEGFGVVQRPEWVIVGARSGDGYLVIASTKLTRAEVEAEVDWRSERFGGSPYRLDSYSTRYTMVVTMETFVMAYGASYGEALRTVMNTWSPDEGFGRSPALDPGRRELPGG